MMKKYLTLLQSKEKKFRTPRERRIQSEKLRSIPNDDAFMSNHVMINRDRTKHYRHQLTRSKELDEIARKHVNIILEENGKIAPDLNEENRSLLHQYLGDSCRFAINVDNGPSIRKIHDKFMKKGKFKQNILNADFDCMGVGSVRDLNGLVHICQIFVQSKAQATSKI